MSDDNSVQWRSAALVVTFGAAGGVLSWIYSMTLGKPIGSGGLAAFGASIVLGMGASFIGVYVLANSDLRNLMRTLGFALLCGFSWKPVFEAGQALITDRVQEQGVEESAEAAREQIAALDSASGSQLTLGIAQLEETSKTLLKQSQSVGDPRLRQQLLRVVGQSVEALEKTSESAPEDSARALGAVGTAASLADRPAITRVAADSLEKLAERRDYEVPTAAAISNSLVQMGAAAESRLAEPESKHLLELGRRIYTEAEHRAAERPEALQELQELTRGVARPGAVRREDP